MPGSKRRRSLSRKQKYDAVRKDLEAQVQDLARSAAAAEKAASEQHQLELLLAEGIIQHKVLCQLVRPMQLGGNHAASTSQPTGPHRSKWLEQAATTNLVLRRLLQAAPDEVKALIDISTGDARQLTVICMRRLLVLAELLSPQRYPVCLVSPGTTAHAASPASTGRDAVGRTGCPGSAVAATLGTSYSRSVSAASDGNTAAAAGDAAADALSETAARCSQPDDLQPDAVQMADEEAKSVMHDAVLSAVVLLLHSCGPLLQLNTINLATGQPCTPPLSHYLKAAKRLHLTSRQVQHLQLLLKQYNRMTKQQYEAGTRLVSLLADSFGLLCSLCQGTGPPLAAGAVAASAAGGPGVSGVAGMAEVGRCSLEALQSSAAPQNSASTQDTLEQQLQQHMDNRFDLLTVMSLWVINTLTPWQIATYFIACWPYHAHVLNLLELSTFLTPDDSPQLQINASICDAAARAAGLADEVGYTGAQAFMEHRCQALEAQLQWLMQESQLL